MALAVADKVEPPDERPGVMRADDDRRLRPDHRRGVQADAGLREDLRPDRVGDPRPEPGTADPARITAADPDWAGGRRPRGQS